MNKNKNSESLCKNVFKSGENIITKRFTQKWIELINSLEKSDSVRF